MSDSTPTRNKQLLDDEHESSSSSSSKPSVVQSSISGIQKGVKGIASGIGNFTHMAISGIAGLMGIPSKAVSIALAVLMGTSSLAIIGTSDTSTDSTAIRSESVTNLDYVDHPNEQEAYFDTLTSLEKVDAAQKIYNYLRSLDYTDESIAGILSNIEAESGLLSDYYTGKEISLYTETNEIIPTGMTSDKKNMYEAFYKRNWRDYTTALYNEYKSDDPYASRGLSNRVRYQIRTEHAELAKSCLAVGKKTGDGTSSSVDYLPGFGLFQFAGERACDYIYFVNCQSVNNDYNHDNINDQWVSASLQIAYLYFENKECEPGVRVNDWGTDDYYGKYGQQIVVDINKTYETEPNNDAYKDPNNWKIAHCLNSITSTGNVVYEYFTILIEEKQATTWKDNKACTLPYPGVQPATLLDGVTKHKSQEIEYTLTYKPMLYTFVIPKDKVGTVNKSSYNQDSAYLTEINNKLQTLTPKDAVAYMKSIGGTSFTEKDDFLKDKDGNDLDYSGEFKTTSYWKWEDEKVGDTFKNEAPDSLDLRRKYSDWQDAITDYNNAVNKLKEYHNGNKVLKEYIGRYIYAKQLKEAQNSLYQLLSDYMGNDNFYAYAYDGIGYNSRTHSFGYTPNNDANNNWISTRPQGWNTFANILERVIKLKDVLLKTSVSGSYYDGAYGWTNVTGYNPRSDATFFSDPANADAQVKNWCNLMAVVHNNNNKYDYGLWTYTSDLYDYGWSMSDDYAVLLDIYRNAQGDMQEWPNFYNALWNLREASSTNSWSQFIIDPNPGYSTAFNYENAIITSGYLKYTDDEYNKVYAEWTDAARNLNNTYEDLQRAYDRYKPKYDKFMSDRKDHETHDIDYIGSTINGRNLHVHTSDNQRCNGDDFYSNALVRKDPKRFQSIQRGFNTYWYRAGLIGTSSLAKDYPGRVQADPAENDEWLRVDFGDNTPPAKYHVLNKHNNSNFPYILDGFDMYYTYNHRYDIYWKGDDYSYSGSIASNTTTKTDEYGVSYKEFTPTGGKTNGYSGYLMSAAYKFDYLMDLAARPSNKYQDGEDMAFQNAIYFYTNYLGYDMTGVDPYTAVNSTSSDEKIKSFRAHCKRARYWYRILVNEKWSEKLGIKPPDNTLGTKSPDNTSGKVYEDRRMDYKNEIYSHLPKVNGSRLWCKDTDTVDNVLYADATKKVFNTQDMVQWATGKADELYNYNGNIFDNHTLASTAVSMSYPYGEECYAVDDTVNKFKFAAGLSSDSTVGVKVDTYACGYVGRRMTAMNAAVSFVTEAFAYIVDDTDPFSVGYYADDIVERMGEIAPGVDPATKESDDARKQAISELGEIIIRGNNPVTSISTVIRASGRDDTFPATFDELYTYLGIAEKPDKYVMSIYDGDCSDYTTDISVIKDRLTARNEEDFDESKWSLVDFIHKKKNKQQDDTKKISDGAGKWEVQGILTDGDTNGNKDLISYKSLKPGDICVSYNGIFMFVGSDANTKFFDYPDLKNSKYAVCYAETDTYTLAERARQTGGESVPDTNDGMAYSQWISVIEGSPERLAALINIDGTNATGLTCRELDDTGEGLYIKQLIQEARDGMNKGYKNSSPYIVFRSINDDYEMSGYYKLLNACDFRAYQDGRLKSSVLYRSVLSMFYNVTGEQGVGINSSTDETTMKAILRKLSACYGFDMDNISSSGGDGPRRHSIADLIEKAKENMANKS